MRLIACRWTDFQHYKNRRPPWIRLHRTLLDNPQFQRLPVASRALAPMLWLIASESTSGEIELEPGDIAFKLHMSVETLCDALNPLLQANFFEADDEFCRVLAACLQHAPNSCSETETETETETEAETDSEERQSRDSLGVTVVTRRARRAPAAPAPTANAWEAYRKAYITRYRAEPVRNATVNGQLAQFVARVGGEEAPEVAAFFLTHNGGLYVAAMHPTNLLLRDAEKLRTEWVTRRQVTHTQAMQADRTQTNLNSFGPMIAEARAREAKEQQHAADIPDKRTA